MTAGGTLVLDSEGLSKTVSRDPSLTAWLVAAEEEDTRVITSAATLVEARDPRIPQPRFDWALSRIHVEPVSEEIARAASKLLAAAKLHGHKYAIDAMLSATALRCPGPVTVLTSDPEDIAQLCGDRVRTVKV
ncbi:DNA-binding protein [Streptomyces sp. A3M-1-3]|uniref:DNA-binding protein n=1 Tax=Streptomyces sp. A3M-1-3 TaxID=2962044 RepID=UPI0020B66E2B|nr:DNA-binding protein [Streptomyces sp. A3M-1-3]MCP3821214.1 DNA-binding protein [Streptomyces sp. A3M-1-3]